MQRKNIKYIVTAAVLILSTTVFTGCGLLDDDFFEETTEISDEVKEEIKQEIKDELREEIEDEIRDQLISALGAELMADTNSKEDLTEPEDVYEEEEIVHEEPEEIVVAELPEGFGRSDSYEVSYIGDFVSTDLDGNEITQDYFANAEYTMINIWGTFCGPCINEMPELEKMNMAMPDNMQMLGIVCDVYSEDDYGMSDALDIVEETGVTYTNIITSMDIAAYTGSLQYVPVTLFVDAEGYVITEPIVGADVTSYKRIVKKLGR